MGARCSKVAKKPTSKSARTRHAPVTDQVLLSHRVWSSGVSRAAFLFSSSLPFVWFVLLGLQAFDVWTLAVGSWALFYILCAVPLAWEKSVLSAQQSIRSQDEATFSDSKIWRRPTILCVDVSCSLNQVPSEANFVRKLITQWLCACTKQNTSQSGVFMMLDTVDASALMCLAC